MVGAGGVRQAARSPLPGRVPVAELYRRAAEPWVRGMRGVVVTVVLFALAGAVSGRGGAGLAGGEHAENR